MEISQKKREFLNSLGFEIDYEGKTRIYKNAIVRMEMWKKFSADGIYRLYIHFDSEDGNYCNLYYGENDNAEVFSERNLVSEMKKRLD